MHDECICAKVGSKLSEEVPGTMVSEEVPGTALVSEVSVDVPGVCAMASSQRFLKSFRLCNLKLLININYGVLYFHRFSINIVWIQI